MLLLVVIPSFQDSRAPMEQYRKSGDRTQPPFLYVEAFTRTSMVEGKWQVFSNICAFQAVMCVATDRLTVKIENSVSSDLSVTNSVT